MRHEGPLPDEALPPGEDTLSPEELDKVASFMFMMEEQDLRDFPDRITMTSVTSEEWDCLNAAKFRLQINLFNALKRNMIKRRNNLDN